MSPWKRTYWTIWVANLITALGMMSFLPFFPGHLRSLGVAEGRIELWSGLIFGAAPLSAAFMSPVWGALGDRFGRKLMVLRAMFAIALFVGLMGFARSPWELFALRICQGVFSGFVPPSITLVSVGAPDHRQGQVAGSIQSAMSVGAIGGPMLGALISSAYGTRTVFFGVSVLALTSALVVALFASEQGARRVGDGSGVRGLAGGMLQDFGLLAASRELRAAVILMFVIQFGVGATNPLLELFVEEVTGGGRIGTGALFSILAATTVVAMPLWGRFGDRVGHRRALVLCALASGIVIGLHGVAASFAGLVVGRVLLGASASGAGPISFGVAAAETGPDRRGGAFGVVFSARALSVSLGAISGGAIAAGLGIRGLFALCGVAVLVTLAAIELRGR